MRFPPKIEQAMVFSNLEMIGTRADPQTVQERVPFLELRAVKNHLADLQARGRVVADKAKERTIYKIK